MAKKATVALADDLDGGPAAETVRFGFDGATYEIDLSAENASALRREFAPFIEHARKARKAQPRPDLRTRASRQRSGDIRAWAKDNGIQVSAHGRIAADVVARYHAAVSIGRWHRARRP